MEPVEPDCGATRTDHCTYEGNWTGSGGQHLSNPPLVEPLPLLAGTERNEVNTLIADLKARRVARKAADAADCAHGAPGPLVILM